MKTIDMPPTPPPFQKSKQTKKPPLDLWRIFHKSIKTTLTIWHFTSTLV